MRRETVTRETVTRETVTGATLIRARFSGENGAGTVLALGLVAVALAVVTWVSLATSMGVKQLELQALADRIALTADDALRGKISGAPCELAKEISAELDAKLDTCRIVESKVFIELHIYMSFGFSTNIEALRLNASAAAEPVAA
jgi:secretion/DNA translocation related TadE-like protein